MPPDLSQQKVDLQEALDLERLGQFSAAATLLVECVRTDLGNLEVLTAFLRNLSLSCGPSPDASPPDGELPPEVKFLLSKKNSFGLMSAAPRFLSAEPYNAALILHVAETCAGEGLFEHELAYLEYGSQALPNNTTVVKRCAKVLAKSQDYTGALSCWRRLEQLRPDDDEPPSMIVRLTIAECRDLSGIFYQANSASKDPSKAETSRPRRKRPKVADAVSEEIKGVNAKLRHVPMQTLENEVADNPATADNYLRLAALYLEKGRDFDAENLLAKGRNETGDDPRIRFLYDDIRIRRLDAKIELTQRHLEIQDLPEKREALAGLLETRNELETEVLSRRTQRDPENAALHHELGLRLLRSGNFRTASHHFKQAMQDPAQTCEAAFQIGECMRQLGDFKEALRHYRMSADASSEFDQMDTKAQALFRAAEIAVRIRLFRLARRFLGTALQLVPGHAESQQLLKKIENDD